MLNVFAISVNVLPLLSWLLSFFIATAIICTLCLGLYLLFVPADTLVVMYQNYHLKRSMKPLKDEDFGSYSSIVRRMRGFGVISLLVAAGLTMLVIHSFDAAPVAS